MTSPDSGIQKNVVAKTHLPLLDSSARYLVRYRVKTADGIAATAWSPIYKATKDSISPIFDEETGTHHALEREIKSHGKSFDVSWKFTNKVTELTETPEQINNLPLDAYSRWGGTILDVATSGTIHTITVDYDHHFYAGQTVTAELVVGGMGVEDSQVNYIVKDIIDNFTFTVDSATTTYLSIGNRLWSKWEFVTTTSTNSFSVPIPAHHQSTIYNTYYAEFMVHLATVLKDRQETTPNTLIFYTESVSTRAKYDAGSIV